jgi:hypothetical protein
MHSFFFFIFFFAVNYLAGAQVAARYADTHETRHDMLQGAQDSSWIESAKTLHVQHVPDKAVCCSFITPGSLATLPTCLRLLSAKCSTLCYYEPNVRRYQPYTQPYTQPNAKSIPSPYSTHAVFNVSSRFLIAVAVATAAAFLVAAIVVAAKRRKGFSLAQLIQTHRAWVERLGLGRRRLWRPRVGKLFAQTAEAREAAAVGCLR